MEEQTTLNTGGDTTSPADSSPASGNFESFISTMPEDRPAESPAEAQNTDDTAAQETPEEGGDKGAEATGEEGAAASEGEPAGETDTKPEPFHKHPRFQEITKQNREMKQALQEMRDQMETLAKDKAGGEAEKPDLDTQFAEINKQLEDGDISLSDAMNKQRQLIEASSQQRLESVMQQQKREADAEKVKGQFLADNPDYTEVLEGGELDPIMQANPVHDEVSAYYHHKWESEKATKEKEVKEAVDKAVKETEARIRKEFAAKKNAASLGDSAAHVPRSGPAPELQDTSKFGGKVNVLASRLRSLREKSG